jgi:hypothetical protein
MVVMVVGGEFVHRVPVVEIVAFDDAGGFKLGQYAINRGEPDGIVGFDQLLVNILRGQMVRIGPPYSCS